MECGEEEAIWNYKMHYHSPDTVTQIKIIKSECLGHVIRMKDTRIPEMILNTKPEGRRRIRRPKLRWLGDV
jgi:hypothetical protein